MITKLPVSQVGLAGLAIVALGAVISLSACQEKDGFERGNTAELRQEVTAQAKQLVLAASRQDSTAIAELTDSDSTAKHVTHTAMTEGARLVAAAAGINVRDIELSSDQYRVTFDFEFSGAAEGGLVEGRSSGGRWRVTRFLLPVDIN